MHYYATNCVDATPAGMAHPFNGCGGELIIGEGLERIPEYIFMSAAFTGNLNIPNSIEEIEGGAFANCTGFTGDLTIPNSVTTIDHGAFSGCSGFTGNLTLSNSLTTIGERAFYNCSGFTGNLTLSNSLTTIGERAFYNCSGLDGSLSIPQSVTTIGPEAFAKCSGFTEVSYNAINCSVPTNYYYPPFKDCGNLGVLTIGENVMIIPKYLFYTANFTEVYYNAINCADATDQDYPNFSSCNGDLIIGNNVGRIPKGMFRSSHFSNIILPNSITEIREDAFYGSMLSNVYYLGDVYQWCNISFENPSANPIITAHTLYINNNLLRDLIIPESISNIQQYTFAGASCLNSIIIPNSVVSIEKHAFAGCSGLTSITLPKYVNYIGEYAFSFCTGLTNVNYYADNCTIIMNDVFNYCPITEVDIGNNVQRIPNGAFKDCSTLNTIIAFGITPPVLGYNAFAGISPVATLFVPCGSLMAYFSSWNIFEYNNIHEDCTPRLVSISPNITGGTIIPSVSQATMGQEVILNVTPNSGMQLISITAYNTNNPSQIVPVSPFGNSYRFIMPPYAVTVSATFDTCVLLEENGNVTVNIYPNPTIGYVNIEAENLKHITISNMLGQVIYDGNASGNEFAYDFSKHKTGFYLIRIETSSGVAVKKVSVTR